MVQQRVVIAKPENVAISVSKYGQVVRGSGLEFKLVAQVPSPGGYTWVHAESESHVNMGQAFLVRRASHRPSSKRMAGRPKLRRQSEGWALHREFAGLETTEDAILEFAWTYGWLGVDRTKVSYRDESGTAVEAMAESLDLWKHQILKMRTILDIIRKWSDNPNGEWFRDYQWRGEGCYSPRLLAPGVWASIPYGLPRQVESAADAYLAAQEELQTELTRGVRLRIEMSDTGLPTMHLCSQSLLANMYIALAKELTRQVDVYRQCVCGAWFIPKRANALQCSPTCRVNKSRAKRRQRERQQG